LQQSSSSIANPIVRFTSVLPIIRAAVKRNLNFKKTHCMHYFQKDRPDCPKLTVKIDLVAVVFIWCDPDGYNSLPPSVHFTMGSGVPVNSQRTFNVFFFN
jgi:hypothetical protein